MRIRTRLLVFALVSIVLVCAAGYVAVANGRRVREAQLETLLNSGPIIQQLENIKFSGLKIIASTTDWGLLLAEDPVRNAARLRDEELEIVEATRDLNDSLGRARQVWARAGWDRAEIEKMDHAARQIQTLSALVRASDSQAPTMAQHHQEFEDAEREFLTTVDAVTNHRRQTLLARNSATV